MKTAAIVLARMGSARLPGKHLLPMAGKPSIVRMIERLKQCLYLDEIILATSTESENEKLLKLAGGQSIRWFRGDIDDVLLRMIHAAQESNVDIIVDVTGDCPLIDPTLVDHAIMLQKMNGYDYVSNVIRRCYPDGFDVQVFPRHVLEQVNHIYKNERLSRVSQDCAGWNITKYPKRFRLWHFDPFRPEQYWPDLGLTLDEKADYILINKIFEHFLIEEKNPTFGIDDILEFIRANPELIEINKGVIRNET